MSAATHGDNVPEQLFDHSHRTRDTPKTFAMVRPYPVPAGDTRRTRFTQGPRDQDSSSFSIRRAAPTSPSRPSAAR